MITSENKKVIKQNTFNISFRNNNEERNMYHLVLRRATLTSTPVSTIIKQYVDEGVKSCPVVVPFNKKQNPLLLAVPQSEAITKYLLLTDAGASIVIVKPVIS